MDALQIAAQAAKGFERLKCAECAGNIKKELLAAGYHGEEIELRAADAVPFMVCLSYDEGRTCITQNGRHLGVRVGTSVFDNLHPDGLAFETWLADFAAVSGVVIHRIETF